MKRYPAAKDHDLFSLLRKETLVKRTSDNDAFSLSLNPWSTESFSFLFSECETPTFDHI